MKQAQFMWSFVITSLQFHCIHLSALSYYVFSHSCQILFLRVDFTLLYSVFVVVLQISKGLCIQV